MRSKRLLKVIFSDNALAYYIGMGASFVSVLTQGKIQ